jgi:hypothetical protein
LKVELNKARALASHTHPLNRQIVTAAKNEGENLTNNPNKELHPLEMMSINKNKDFNRKIDSEYTSSAKPSLNKVHAEPEEL